MEHYKLADPAHLPRIDRLVHVSKFTLHALITCRSHSHSGWYARVSPQSLLHVSGHLDHHPKRETRNNSPFPRESAFAMAMAIDSRQQPQYSQMGYDAMRFPPPPPPPAPQFTNPWASAPGPPSHMYATSLPPQQQSNVSSDPQRYVQAPNVSPAYAGGQISAPALPSGIPPVDSSEFLDQPSHLQFAQDGINPSRPYGVPYTSATTTAGTFAPTSAPQYAPIYGYSNDRRPSHPSVLSSTMADHQDLPFHPSSVIDMKFDRLNSVTEAERQSFNDALDASRGMVAMSQSDITPRNIYGTASSGRSSTDSYGFPSTHSSHSSISSASTYPSYYNSSVSEASVGDYSSASESVDMPNPRTLPRPNGLPGQMPPAPQSMMGQFSSKVSSSSQKKHKCKICDKRFTRPSSLQTHMYSHTGEKRKFLSHLFFTLIQFIEL